MLGIPGKVYGMPRGARTDVWDPMGEHNLDIGIASIQPKKACRAKLLHIQAGRGQRGGALFASAGQQSVTVADLVLLLRTPSTISRTRNKALRGRPLSALPDPSRSRFGFGHVVDMRDLVGGQPTPNFVLRSANVRASIMQKNTRCLADWWGTNIWKDF
ncbi:hypothetical protein BJV78DRAFT_1156782 [Lactifluus subvellereus]|nr:hypothetical protein BJV78DRAFT_1156782 [Lactifluus subvellereus]